LKFSKRLIIDHVLADSNLVIGKWGDDIGTSRNDTAFFNRLDCSKICVYKQLEFSRLRKGVNKQGQITCQVSLLSQIEHFIITIINISDIRLYSRIKLFLVFQVLENISEVRIFPIR